MELPGGQAAAMTISRRGFLGGMGAGSLVWFTRHAWVQNVDALGQLINREVGARNIGIEVARFIPEGDSVRELFRFGINQNELRPTASCFKAWVVLYYFTFTPEPQWADADGTDTYNVAVNSHNVATGRLIRDTGQYQDFGNDLEKFNDFLIYSMSMEHGIASWNWEGNPLVGFVDGRFAAGPNRLVRAQGTTHEIGNVTTAADTLNGYRELYRRSFAQDADPYGGDPDRRKRTALRTMDLLAKPSDNAEYDSPVERAAGRDVYIGKDGVLPVESTTAGRVINDAGLIPMETGAYGISFFSVAESEFSAIEILRTIVDGIYEVEQSLAL
ncbi:MAG: hypothetical protein AAF787_21235 [Chloroflexota bacterium]